MKNISDFKALFFDMDGTLVNSEPLHEKAWCDTLERFELSLASDWFHQWTGSTDFYLLQGIMEEFGIDLDVEGLLDEKRNRFLDIARESPLLFDGVKEGLDYLNSYFPIIMVTSSSRISAENVLKWSDMEKYFDTIITFNDVENPKPHPEPYLKAARFLNLSPESCLAFEDSLSGIKSAKTAGCFTVAVENSLPAEQLQSADVVLKDSRALMHWLKSLL